MDFNSKINLSQNLQLFHAFFIFYFFILNSFLLLYLLLLFKVSDTFGKDNELHQNKTAPFFFVLFSSPLFQKSAFAFSWLHSNQQPCPIFPAAELNMPSETVNTAAYNL